MFIKSVIAIYVAAGLLLLFGDPKMFPDYIHSQAKGIFAFVSIAIILAVPYVFKAKGDPHKEELVKSLQKVTAVVLIISGTGGLGLNQLYQVGIPWDKYVHFTNSLLITAASYHFLRGFYGKNLKQALFIAGAIIIIGGFVWEVFEYYMDMYAGTDMFKSMRTAIFDTAANIAGMAIAMLAIYASEKRKWPFNWSNN